MIVIPAAGEGRRFKEAGYKGPKHMIPLAGRPMVEWVAENLLDLDRTQTEVVVATEALVGKTSGAIETIRRALTGFPPKIDEPLIIGNCDQLILPPVPAASARGVFMGNGLVYTFKSANPAHSYVKTDKYDRITSIVEKPAHPDSDWRAVSGVYVFPSPVVVADYIGNHVTAQSAGESYFSDVLRRMIEDGYNLYSMDVPTAILGTPEDFQRFETAASIVMSQEGRFTSLFEGLAS